MTVHSECDHQNKNTVGNCQNCRKQICRICIKSFGYYCSLECKNNHLNQTKSLQSREQQIEQKKLEILGKKINQWIYILLPIIIIFISGVYYIKKSQNPIGKIIWEKPITTPYKKITSYQNTFYTISPNQIEAWDIQSGESAWKLNLPFELDKTLPILFSENHGYTFTQNLFLQFNPQNGSKKTFKTNYLNLPPLFISDKVWLLDQLNKKGEHYLYCLEQNILKILKKRPIQLFNPTWKYKNGYILITSQMDQIVLKENGDLLFKKAYKNKNEPTTIIDATEKTFLFAHKNNLMQFSKKGDLIRSKTFPHPILDITSNKNNIFCLTAKEAFTLNVKNLEEIWKVENLSQFNKIHTIDKHVLFFKTTNNQTTISTINTYNANNGQLDWSLNKIYGFPDFDHKKFAYIKYPSKGVYPYFKSIENDSIPLFCLRLDSGKLLWTKNFYSNIHSIHMTSNYAILALDHYLTAIHF